MTVLIAIVAVPILVIIALLVWVGVGAKNAMNRNDNKRGKPK